MHDPRVRRHDAKPCERPLSPAQQGVALAVPLELEVRVHLEGGGRAELVHDHRVVDHELGGEQRVDLPGVAAHPLHRVAHRGEVHDGRNPGEVLHEDPRRHEGDLVLGRLLRVPARQLLDFVGPHRAAVLAAQQVLEQEAEGVGEATDRQAPPLQGVEAVDLEAPTTDLERAAAAERVERHCSTGFTSTTKYSVSPKQCVGTPLCCL